MARNLSLKPAVCTGSFSSSEQKYVLRRKQYKDESDGGKAHSKCFEEPYHLSNSYDASTQVAGQVDYKPANDEEWDDMESFDEQMRLEKETNVDVRSELSRLQEEADLPLEELLKRYKQTAASVIDEDSSAHPAYTESSPERNSKIEVDPPFLLKFELRDYQKFGLKWLASCYNTGVNAILADEMGLGKTIQTISLLAHLACEHSVWGPHLVIVPTSVMVNWEVEFKKWCPAFKILTYFGTQKERKLKRAGWSKPNTFNICITTYRIAVQDQTIFRRKRWNYLILDEAHMIKNWRSQRWQTLLTFESCHRLLITGTPLQNDVMELWALMHFLMPDLFQSHAEFKNWFSNPLIGMAEGKLDIDDRLTARLHAVLRPFILRRLKADVERSLPSKVEHIVKCRLSRRQKRLYDEYMSSNDTVQTLNSSNVMGVMNCLMQLRKVCNHPDLFAGRNIVSAFDMPNVLELNYPMMVSRMLLSEAQFTRLHSSEPIKHCVRDVTVQQQQSHRGTFMNIDAFLLVRLKSCRSLPVVHRQQLKLEGNHLELMPMVTSYDAYTLRREDAYIQSRVTLDHSVPARELLKFMFRIPIVRARTPVVRHELDSSEQDGKGLQKKLRPWRELMIRGHLVFPDARLVQFDCGKLQALASLLRSLKSAGHKVVIFTQMTKVLDILERFLNLYSYSYVRLDGTTKPDQRQILMQRFNADLKLFAFILSTRSGGFGINLTGADTVIFYDSDWNPAVDAQAQDRCHRIGQTKEVNIYRLISEDTIEENILKKALQKRELDELAIQQGQFNLSSLNQYGNISINEIWTFCDRIHTGEENPNRTDELAQQQEVSISL